MLKEQEVKLMVRPQENVLLDNETTQSITFTPMSKNYKIGYKIIDDAMTTLAPKAIKVLEELIDDYTHPRVQLMAVKLIKDHFRPRLTIEKA